MAIRNIVDKERGLARTVIEDELNDEVLIGYYERVLEQGIQRRYKRELIDGRKITKVSVTAAGHDRLAALLSQHEEELRTHRAAMLAATDVVYGMFRMWEMARGTLGYELKVFRDEDEALRWLERD